MAFCPRILHAVPLAILAASCSGADSGRELHALGVYEACSRSNGPTLPGRPANDTQLCSDSGSNISVLVDRPGVEVTLVLTDYVPARWNVRTTPGTEVKRVAFWGNSRNAASRVYLNDSVLENVERTAGAVPVYDEEGRAFRQLVERAPDVYGFDRIASFHGRYYASRSGFEVRELQYDKPALQRDYLAGQTRASFLVPNMSFPAALNGVPGIYDLSGTLLRATPEKYNKKVVAVPELETTYTLNDEGFAKRSASGGTMQIRFPQDFPKFNRPLAATYDSKRKLLIALASAFSPNGYLFSYDPFNYRWTLLQEAREFGLSGVHYDEVRDQYIAVRATRYVDVVKFPPEGAGSGTLVRIMGEEFPGLRDFDVSGVIEYDFRAVQGDNLVLAAEDPGNNGYRLYLVNLLSNRASLVRYVNR